MVAKYSTTMLCGVIQGTVRLTVGQEFGEKPSHNKLT